MKNLTAPIVLGAIGIALIIYGKNEKPLDDTMILAGNDISFRNLGIAFLGAGALVLLFSTKKPVN